MQSDRDGQSAPLPQRCMELFQMLPTSPQHRWLIAADWLEEAGAEVIATAFREGLWVLDPPGNGDSEGNEDGQGNGESEAFGFGKGDGYGGGSIRSDNDRLGCASDDGNGDGEGYGNGSGEGSGHADGEGGGHA